MKSFIYKIVIYTTIVFSVLGTLQIIVDSGLRKANDNDFGDWNRIFNGEINSDIIILGNSRAFVQYNPIILKEQLKLSCYNLGMDGTTIDLQQARLNTLLQYNPKPKVLILNIDILSLNKGTSIYSYGQYLPYLSNNFINDAINDYKPNIKITSMIPMLKYTGLFGLIKHGIHNFFKPENNYEYINGYFARDLQWQEALNLEKITDKNGNIVYDETSLEFGKLILKNIIDICNQENIKLILVHTPYHYKLYEHLPQQDKIIDCFVSEADDNSVHFLDYSKDSIMYSSDYFYNMTHLNSNGADIFSSKLAEDIKPLITNK